MANREIEAILKISAKMGNMAALKTLQKEMRKVNDQAVAHNRAQTALARGTIAATTAAYGTIARYAAPAAIAYGTARAFKSYAEAERQIERIGITADASAEETRAAMGRIYDVARDLHLPFQDVVAGVDALAASGKNFREIFELLPAVGKTAQASGSAVQDVATTADAIAGSFGIAAGEMERAFDILAYQGKLGKFELKDMSQYLPSLAPAFAALGYKGEEGLTRLAAALQVVRMETGTSGEAATSFMDVISKIESETVTNNFRKRFGVDLRKELKKSKDSGEDLLEAFVRISREAVKGDLSKLPQLFTDKQMLIGMRALINHMDTLRSSVASTSNAAGTVDGDIKRLSTNVQASIDDMANSWDRLVSSIGKTVAPGIVPVLDGISSKLDGDAIIREELNRRGLGAWDRFSEMIRLDQNPEERPALLQEIEARKKHRNFAGGQSPRMLEEDLIAPARQRSGKKLGPKGDAMPVDGPIPVYRPAEGVDALTPAQKAAAADRQRWTEQARRIAEEAAAAVQRQIDAYNATPRHGALVDGVSPGNITRPRNFSGGGTPRRPDPPRPNFASSSGPSPREAQEQSMQKLRRAEGDVRLDLEDLGIDWGGLRDAGQQAGESISEAARRVNEAGAQAGSTFSKMLEGVGQRLGAEAAASFKANLGTLTVNARVNGGPTSTNVNRGETMPNAGGVSRPVGGI